MNSHHTADNLFLIDSLNHIPRLEIHQNRVTRILNTMMLSLDLTERALQPVPLRLVLLAALGDGDRVLERGVVAPEREFSERGAAGEEVEDRANDGLLL